MSKKTRKQTTEKQPEPKPAQLTNDQLEAVAGGCCAPEADEIALDITTELDASKCCRCH